MTACAERHLPQFAHGVEREGQKGIAKEAES